MGVTMVKPDPLQIILDELRAHRDETREGRERLFNLMLENKAEAKRDTDEVKKLSASAHNRIDAWENKLKGVVYSAPIIAAALVGGAIYTVTYAARKVGSAVF